MTRSIPASLERLAQKELIRRLNASNTARQFGFALALAEPGHVVMRMQVGQRHMQVHGVVHGGVLAALADTAGGLATFMSLHALARVATIEMKINYLEPVEKGTVFADARVLRAGKNIAVVDCDLRDDADRLVGKALMTFSIGPEVDRKKGTGKAADPQH